MTIVVTTPAPNNSPLYRLGQGLRIVGTLTGPTAIDDTLHATLTDSFIGTIATHGQLVVAGLATFDLAFDEELVIGAGVDRNRTLTLALELRNAGGAIIDSVGYPAAYTHDPESGIGSLIHRNVTKWIHQVYT